MSKGKENVSVIGLGVMGAELARVLLREGHPVTVWNRTAAKAEPLVNEGALLAPSAALAIGASPIVIVCIDDYSASRSLLETDEAAPFLKGKSIIELSTGTPSDARDAEQWAREHGIEYLDGAIMATPSQVGRPDTTILVSGSSSVFEQTEPVLRSLAGNLTYVGEPVGNAAASDLAILSYWFGGILGFFHGVLICEAEGLPVDSFGATVASLAPVIAEQNQKMGDHIHAEKYDDTEATVRTCTAAFDLLIRHAREAGINSEFPEFGARIFRRAVDAGHGKDDVAAVIKVLRDKVETRAV